MNGTGHYINDQLCSHTSTLFMAGEALLVCHEIRQVERRDGASWQPKTGWLYSRDIIFVLFYNPNCCPCVYSTYM